MLMLGRKQVSPGYFPFKTIESATNCILEIPQNLKLTLENNVLTLKAGSYITECGSTYALDTVANDISKTFGALPDGKYYIFSVPTGIQTQRNISEVTSGTEPPATGTNTSLFFNTTDKGLYAYDTSTNTWVLWVNRQFYPICILEFNSGVASFAKDSNGNDIIFNGFGFVGQTKYILPGVKILLSAGKYNDGTNRNINYINNSLQLSTSGGTYLRRIFMREGALQITTNAFYYDNSTNLWYDQDDNPINGGCAYLGDCDTFNGVVTNFTINPPLGYWRYFVKMIQ